MDAFRQSSANHLEPLTPIVSFQPDWGYMMKLKSEKPSNATSTIHIDDLVQWRSVYESVEIITFLSFTRVAILL